MYEPDFDDSSILPPPPAGASPILHDREYRVRAFRVAEDRVLIQGAVRDQKPPGLYLREDPDPITVHHMQLAIEVAFPDLTIVDVATEFESFPHTTCPSIIPHYEGLVGLSIARGFTHKVRELFGGPRGCTHTTALLQAMAPVAVQCFWSMRAAQAALDGEDAGLPFRNMDPDDQSWRRTIGSCHVWDPEGPHVAAREAGEPWEVPVFLRQRLEELGIDAAN